MKKSLILSLLLFASIFGFSQSKATHHILNVTVDPGKAYIKVSDSVFTYGAEEIVISINAAFKVSSFSKNVMVAPVAGTINAKDVGMDRDNSDSGAEVKLNNWKLKLKKGAAYFVMNYEGNINSSFEHSAEDYARGFSETAGIICDSGVYLAGSTHWIPVFNEKPFMVLTRSALLN